MENRRIVVVQIEKPSDPGISRSSAILKDRIEHRCLTQVVDGEVGAGIILTVDSTLPHEGFRIDEVGTTVRIAGGSPRGLLYGIGKFLRTSRYDETFAPSPWRGTSAPQGSLRGMYFATHFHNWYHVASEAEIARYVEDMALWGVNALFTTFPMLNLRDWNDPEAEPAMTMMRQYARAARDLGIQSGVLVGNAMFSDAPQHIRATRLPDPTGRRGNHGHPICPSTQEGHAYILANMRVLFERLSDIGLDLLGHWPYDEGGCACDMCRPWGSNGYFRISRDISLLCREYFPQVKTILSTWMFDTPPEGEWPGLSEALTKENPWLNYILADAHEDFPRYPLDVGVPGMLPLINFPEISMWGNWPWGGVGAHPLPSRLQRLWDQVKHKIEGGLPYSEGIYEDMNKAIVSQFYWDSERSARATLGEYIAYEFCPEVCDAVLTIIDVLEAAAGSSYQKQPVDSGAAQRACRLAEAVNDRLPAWARENWRWEILHIRAVLDHERFAGDGLGSPAAEAALTRLIDIYHCQLETDDPYHHRVRPPLLRVISRCGEC